MSRRTSSRTTRNECSPCAFDYLTSMSHDVPRARSGHGREGRHPLQFGLRTLLWLMVAIAATFRFVSKPNRMADTLFAVVLGHDTRYAPGYSSSRWKGTSIGMRSCDVVSRIGKPIERYPWPNDMTRWAYSAPGPLSQNYFTRFVDFHDGLVVDIEDRFHVD